MKDIKELADKIIKEVWQSPHAMTAGLHADLTQFAQRLIAAYVEGQEPRGWWNPSYPALSIQLTKPYAGGGWEPFYAAPPLTEPAPAVDPHWPNINMDISEKSAAQLQDQVENLAALVNRLCRQVNRFDSGNKVAVAASKYICDNDLIGTSLRKDDEGIQKIIDMVKENSND